MYMVGHKNGATLFLEHTFNFSLLYFCTEGSEDLLWQAARGNCPVLAVINQRYLQIFPGKDLDAAGDAM